MLDFLRRNHKLILSILLLVALFRIANLIGTDKDYNFLEGIIIDYIFRPVFAVIDNVNDLVGRNLEVITNYKQVKEENRKLQDEVDHLNYQQKNLEKIKKENKRLRELLNFKEQVPYQVVGASVISHSADNWSQVVTINRGSEAGIEEKMAVIAETGYLIGVVQRVTNHTAQVLLLIDEQFITGGLVSRSSSRDLGVVRGQKKKDKLLMNNLSWDADVKAGDVIVTSGLSGNLPKGLPIGEIMSVSPDNYGLTQEAKVDPFLELNKLEEVLVIVDFTTKTDISLPPFNVDSLLIKGEE
ncbi:MAG: rod shape-determining protein MreC [Bacillota bacterium]